MKRFTDTEKWSDLWFRKLPLKLKLFWLFVCDRCDAAGVWKLDFEGASFHIGETVTEQEAKEALGHRIEPLTEGRWLIRKFIPFQYGSLSDKCRPHQIILCLAKGYHIALKDGCYTLADRVSDTHKTRQDKTGEDKTGAEGGTGETFSPGTRTPSKGDGNGAFELQSRLNTLYGRNGSPWSHTEEEALVGVAARPDWRSEIESIESYKPRAGKFFPALRGLLERWTEVLDRAQMPEAAPTDRRGRPIIAPGATETF
jgi:hypothetical protein